MGLRIFIAHPSSLLTDHRPHGDGLVAHGFISGLAARGHELEIAAPRVDLRTALPSGAHLHVLDGRRLRAPLDRLVFMARMRRLYARLSRTTPFDVVHQLNPVDVGVSLAVGGVRPPLVLGPYVPDWAPGGEGADAAVGAAALRLKRLVRAAQQRQATTLLISTAAARAKVELAPRAGLHVRTLPPGIDEREWAPGPARPPGQDVLFLANLEVRKGIHVAVDAFALLARELPAARLLVAGGGSQREAVERRVADAGLEDRVLLLGPVERGRVRGVMQACDVYCLASYGEPFGMTALEAMACGKPVVATEAGGLRHLVADRGGRRVPPGDAPALAAALREVLADPARRRAMGEHNRRLVEEHYAWARVIDRLEELYAEAMDEPPGSPGRRRPYR